MVEGIIELTDEAASHDEQDLQNCKSLEKEIENLKELTSEACIYIVHEELRGTKPEAYTPLLISIGPYHHGDSKLSEMENLKLRCLKSILQRREGVITMEQCWNKLKGSKEKAKSYYVGDIKLSDNDFVKMLLLDGCFIVEFFVRRYHFLNDTSNGQEGQEEERDAFIMPSGMENQILLDLFLLENQLPFFVLQQVYDMIFHGNKVAFFEIVLCSCMSMITWIGLTHKGTIEVFINAKAIKHLLQVVHILCNPDNVTLTTKSKNTASKCSICMVGCWTQLSKLSRVMGNKSFMEGSSNSPPNTQQERDYWTTTCFPAACSCFSKQSQDDSNTVRTASELQEAGVDIKMFDEARSLFDIKFENHGKLEIPKLRIFYSTEKFFRNIIAYEQHSCDSPRKYFTDYALFMDYLVNTEKDVILLRMNGVFINWLGDDNEVTYLFNRLCKGVVWSSNFYYARVSNDLNRHCNRPWNVLKAKLRHDYFYTPWAGVSTIAAILLLLLTIAQTVIALLDLLNG